MITDRQKSVLTFLHNFYMANGYPPSIQEIASDQEVACNSIQGNIISLEKKGFITKAKSRARSILLTSKGRDTLA